MMIKSLLVGAALTVTSLTAIPAANAGFELRDASPAPAAQPVPQTKTEKQIMAAPQPVKSYDLEKGLDSSAPALSVYNDRYVPDAVRAKYKLGNDWANAAPSAPVAVAPSTAPVAAAVTESAAAVKPQSVPEQQAVQSSPLTVVPQGQPAEMVARIAPASGNAATPVESWRARKGEAVRDVLRRWSEREDVNLMWASPNAPALQKDFSFIGSYHDAVQNLMKQNGLGELHSQFRPEGLDPVMMAPASTITTSSAPAPATQAQVPSLPVPQTAPQPADKPEQIAPAAGGLSQIFEPSKPDQKDAKPETRWFGLSGAPLAEVLRVWSEDADVGLIWQAEGNYALKESVSQVGSYEEAVYRALNQYSGDGIRPVGQIYKDETTGKRVLVVRSDAS